MIQRTNHNTDPACLKTPANSWAVVMTRDENGKVTVTPTYNSSHGVKGGTARTWRGSLAGLDGYIICSITSGMSAECAALACHKDADTVERLDLPEGWSAVVSRISKTGNNNELWVFGDQPVTLQCCGIYSPQDWERIRQLWQQGRLTIPWFGAAADATAEKPGDVILMP